MKKYINLLTLCIIFYRKSIRPYVKLKSIMEGARWRGLIVRKYLGSHRELRPAGAEYKINDGLLKNLAAHSGLPYFDQWHKEMNARGTFFISLEQGESGRCGLDEISTWSRDHTIVHVDSTGGAGGRQHDWTRSQLSTADRNITIRGTDNRIMWPPIGTFRSAV